MRRLDRPTIHRGKLSVEPGRKRLATFAERLCGKVIVIFQRRDVLQLLRPPREENLELARKLVRDDVNEQQLLGIAAESCKHLLGKVSARQEQDQVLAGRAAGKPGQRLRIWPLDAGCVASTQEVKIAIESPAQFGDKTKRV